MAQQQTRDVMPGLKIPGCFHNVSHRRAIKNTWLHTLKCGYIIKMKISVDHIVGHAIIYIYIYTHYYILSHHIPMEFPIRSHCFSHAVSTPLLRSFVRPDPNTGGRRLSLAECQSLDYLYLVHSDWDDPLCPLAGRWFKSS